MVALESLLLRGNIGVKLVLSRKCYAVNSLKHLVVLVALVVRAGALRQLERLDSSGCVKMRAGAKVDVFALLIEGEDSVVAKLLNALNLIGLVKLTHKLYSLVFTKNALFNKKIFLDYLLHLRLNIFEYFGSEGNLGIEILEKSGFGSRTYSLLCVWVKSFNRLSHNMRRCVTKNLFAFLILVSIKRYLGILRNLG